ncbi:unnamed protein product [Litomosoides sigmodontis]|uniref:C2H2-type domain-containing protein n=1 Tax=Litomosoides sigmodontis TaxID=42156 RepID=A0A3P6U350_LITSI|nr:unnamed protein product [Litomosoides sigmodontis]
MKRKSNTPKTYKFRSNLYQHKCPDRTKNGNIPFNKRLMYRLAVNQSDLFDTRQSSVQQTSERIASTNSDNFLSNRPNLTPPTASTDHHAESIDAPTEVIKSEAMTVKQPVVELREAVAPKKQLDQAVIDKYLQKNKNKLYQCRKCKLQFPTRGYLTRHVSQHNELEQAPLQCEMCPQRFSTDSELRKHLELHSRDSGIVCAKCSAPFRSMLALRRHRNQSRQCVPSSSSFNNQTIDEYAYIDRIEAEAQMCSQTLSATVTDGDDKASEARSFVADDKNDDYCDSASSSAHCYQHLSSSLTRPEGHSKSESETLIYENGAKRTTATTVKIKLGPTPIVSIMKKDDVGDGEVNDMEGENLEVILEEAERSKRLLTQSSNTSSISANRYSSYISSSDRIISSHHSEFFARKRSLVVETIFHHLNFAKFGGGGGVGGIATSNNIQTNTGGESHFTTSTTTTTTTSTTTFDGFLSSSGSGGRTDVYDSLMLEGGRPLILHSHVHDAKVGAVPEPVADLIGCTTQSIRNEITLCETLLTVRTHFLRKIAVYIVYTTVLQIVEFFDSIYGLFVSCFF